jgi:hypothetical protein
MQQKNTNNIAINHREEHCNHPTLIKEFAYGGPTGNFICTKCECLLTSILVEQGVRETPNAKLRVNNAQYSQVAEQ